MKGPSFENLLIRLGQIPGLMFLQTWLNEFRGSRQRIDQRIGDLQGYAYTAKQGMRDISGAVRGAEDDEDDEEGDEHFPDHADPDDDDGYYEAYADDDWDR